MAEEVAVEVETSLKAKKEKKERKKAEKKKSKKRKKPDDGNDSDSDEPTDNVKSKSKSTEGKDEDKIPKKKKKEIKSRLKSKKEEKEELMKKIPRENEDGIAYTKFQIRQMMKRVKRGLAPVATPKELEEKRQNEARLRREEEAELAGLVSTRNATDSNEDNDSDHSGEGEDEDDGHGKNDETENIVHENKPSDDSTGICTPVPPVTNKEGNAKKKTKKSKPVPSDYICQACKNRHTPAHWIYDCPDKVTVRGTNKKKKKERGINDPDAKKVFVSGLPFEVKAKAVEDFFAVTKNCGTVAAVRLVKFDDTQRCNGQAYISFDTIEGAQSAIRLSGITLDVEALSSRTDGNNSKKKNKNAESPAKRKELKLKVSKVLNRRKTKGR